MLLFLRRIRRKLINSGSARKYLLYAIGEILLVTIGILLALQVNNWNEDRKSRNEEHELLLGLENQFEFLHRGLLGRAVINDSLELYASRVLYPTIRRNEFSSKSILEAFYAIKWAGTFDPGSGVLEAMMESGRLELIQNDSLREMLSGWSTIMDETTDNEVLMRELVNREIIPVMSSVLGQNIGRIVNDSYVNTYFNSSINDSELQDFRTLLIDKKFIGLATWRHVWLKSSKGEFYGAAEKALEVLDIIRQEINK